MSYIENHWGILALLLLVYCLAAYYVIPTTVNVWTWIALFWLAICYAAGTFITQSADPSAWTVALRKEFASAWLLAIGFTIWFRQIKG